MKRSKQTSKPWFMKKTENSFSFKLVSMQQQQQQLDFHKLINSEYELMRKWSRELKKGTNPLPLHILLETSYNYRRCGFLCSHWNLIRRTAMATAATTTTTTTSTMMARQTTTTMVATATLWLHCYFVVILSGYNPLPWKKTLNLANLVFCQLEVWGAPTPRPNFDLTNF